MAGGRPTIRTPEIIETVLRGLADGITVTETCKAPGMPDRQTIMRWKREDAEFRAAYTRAREDGAEALADRIVAMADMALQAEVQSIPGIRQATENLKWAAGKFNPKQFGDKIQQEHTGPEGDALRIVIERPPNGG